MFSYRTLRRAEHQSMIRANLSSLSGFVLGAGRNGLIVTSASVRRLMFGWNLTNLTESTPCI